MPPRQPDCNVLEGKDITKEKVLNLTQAAERCWQAILSCDLEDFAAAYRDSFNAQTALFPAMIQGPVQSYIEQYSALPEVLSWKMPGAGGGGYLAMVVTDAESFSASHADAIKLVIRRAESTCGM